MHWNSRGSSFLWLDPLLAVGTCNSAWEHMSSRSDKDERVLTIHSPGCELGETDGLEGLVKPEIKLLKNEGIVEMVVLSVQSSKKVAGRG